MWVDIVTFKTVLQGSANDGLTGTIYYLAKRDDNRPFLFLSFLQELFRANDKHCTEVIVTNFEIWIVFFNILELMCPLEDMVERIKIILTS